MATHDNTTSLSPKAGSRYESRLARPHLSIRRAARAALFVCALIFAAPVFAQEAQPGGVCTTAGEFARSGGIEIPGGHLMVCDGANWISILDYTDTGYTNIGTSVTGAAAPQSGGGGNPTVTNIASQGSACTTVGELAHTADNTRIIACLENGGAGLFWTDLVNQAGIQTFVPAATGTVIGDMTAHGGIAISFDGTQHGTWPTQDSYKTAVSGYVGKDWGVGNSKILAKYIIYGTSNGVNFSGNNVAPGLDFQLYGSNSAPATPTNGTLLQTSGTVDNTVSASNLKHTETAGFDISQPYRYHWITISTNNGIAEVDFTEIEFWEIAP